MSAPRTAYLNARLLDPASGLDTTGALLTEGERIVDLGPELFADGVPAEIETIDCAGHCLAPGLVDMHVFVGEPGAEHQETFATASRAAAAGGITSFAVMPNTNPVIDDVALVEYVRRHANESGPVQIYPVAAVTKGLGGSQLTEIGLLKAAGAVAFSDADRAVADAQVMRRALSYASAHDALLVQHAEEPSLAADGAMNEGEIATRLGLAGIPAAAETVIVERDLRLVELTGARYHAAHLSTATALEAMRLAKARGLAVTCGTAPQYFALNETAIGEYRTFAKTSPPLRAEADRAAVAAAVADHTIDVISSAHCPQDSDSKRLPFEQAAFGVVGLETLLPVTLELHHNATAPLLTLLKAMTVTPASLLGLECGVLKAGAPADLVVFDLQAPWRIDADRFRSKSKNSAFDKRPVQGRCLRTVVGGETVFDYRSDGG